MRTAWPQNWRLKAPRCPPSAAALFGSILTTGTTGTTRIIRIVRCPNAPHGVERLIHSGELYYSGFGKHCDLVNARCLTRVIMDMVSEELMTDTLNLEDGLLGTFLADQTFWPSEPRNLADTGLSDMMIESLVCKCLSSTGTKSGRAIAEHLCLPYRLLEGVVSSLRTRQIIVHSGSAPFNDYYYSLTELGRVRAESQIKACAYAGPAPVPMMDYVISVEAQTLGAEPPSDRDLAEACSDISVDEELLDSIGPAVTSVGGMFLFGASGNGKSTIAKRITLCFGRSMWIPQAIIEDDQIIKLFDCSYHKPVSESKDGIIKTKDLDNRWVKIRRPTVVVGGELTMDSLEIRHDRATNISEAPLQMKSNGGCLLIDDFGRQRIAPAELLNRWIVPLENRHDFLTLGTGKKVQVPFEQLIIFSTNLEPRELVDEAFLRRIPYKIEVTDPGEEEFYRLFELHSKRFDCEYRKEVVEYLVEQHYRPFNRAMRRCHPRDLIQQIRNYCKFRRRPVEMRPEYFDRVVKSYFAMVQPTSSTV